MAERPYIVGENVYYGASRQMFIRQQKCTVCVVHQSILGDTFVKFANSIKLQQIIDVL